MTKYKVPTGHICLIEGEKKKPLEFLSIGDYGKEKNLKADFLGLTKEIEGVPHGDLMPLEDKWVITISSQYGCSMGCKFCDVPKVGKGENATFNDLINQVGHALSLHPEVKFCNRLNLHYARMGEPTWNPEVIHSTYALEGMFAERGWIFHPVVSTMMPKENPSLFPFLKDWLQLKNNLNGEAGLQVSVNTTDKAIRAKTMPHAMDLAGVAYHVKYYLLEEVKELKGRKIALNFALTDAPIDAGYLRKLFDPEYFLCKITPMHKTKACVSRGILTDGGYDHYYPYEKAEQELKEAGFDVIVFVPSHEEDESRITCGNAILADKG